MRIFLAVCASVLIVAVTTGVFSQTAIGVTTCATGRQCLLAPSACHQQKVTAGQCVRLRSTGKFVILSLLQKQICVNATQYVDASCGTPVASLNGACTSCVQVGTAGSFLQYDCGGLYDAMPMLSNCSSSSCGGCGMSRLAYKKCAAVPGLNFLNIFGEFQCSQVNMEVFSDAGCTTKEYASHYALGSCFSNIKFAFV